MSAYTPEVLIRKWGRGELSVEQAIGQILLHVQELHATMAGLERRLYASTGLEYRDWAYEDVERTQEDQ